MAKNPVYILALLLLLAACVEVENAIIAAINPPDDDTSVSGGESAAPQSGAESAETDLTGEVPSETVPSGTVPAETDLSGTAPSGTVPSGTVPSGTVLREDALAAAFDLARRGHRRASRLSDAILDDGASYPPKTPGGFRIALLLPPEENAGFAVSRDIREGAELAMFAMAPADTDMVLVDSTVDTNGAVLDALKADIVLGPLFSHTTIALKERMGTAIPVISFSNDTHVTTITDDVYIIGQTPEAEIATALGHAIDTKNGAARVAIISSGRDYGMRVADAAVEFMAGRGMEPVARFTIDDDVLADQPALSEAIGRFAASRLAGTDYDILVLAGDIAFCLAVAPVLAWHDIDTGSVDLVGTSLWAEPAILLEPSLRRGIFARTPQGLDTEFAALAGQSGIPSPGQYGALGFDAVALAVSIAGDPGDGIIRPSGFAGFTGVFRFTPEGGNMRLLDVHEIAGGASRLIAPAAKGF